MIQSKINGRLYRGSTADLRKRIKEHNADKIKSTKSYRPWLLIYYEAHKDKLLSRKTELFYKTSQGRRQLKKKLGLDINNNSQA